jgi:hypothetical protein
MAGKKGMKRGGRKTMKGKGQQGDGFWDSLKSGLSKVNQFLKDTKLLSTVASMPAVQALPVVGQVASKSAPILQNLGYGQHGGAILSGPMEPMNTRDGPYVGLTSVMSGKGKRGRKPKQMKGKGLIKA